MNSESPIGPNDDLAGSPINGPMTSGSQSQSRKGKAVIGVKKIPSGMVTIDASSPSKRTGRQRATNSISTKKSVRSPAALKA